MKRGTDTAAAVQTSAVVTTTSNSVSVIFQGYTGVVAYLNVKAASGTTPSLVTTLQDSPDGVTWFDIPGGAFAAATAVGLQRLVVPNVGPFVRAVHTVTGTTPSFTIDFKIAGIH
jgi:hypothetical protein